MKLFDKIKEFAKRFKSVQKPLLIRDYRRTKAELFIVKNQLIPNYKQEIEIQNQTITVLPFKHPIRKMREIKKAKYVAKLKMLEDVELPYLEHHFSELTEKMVSLGMRLE